ncbi:hypothetical protein [Pseudosulfitobacter koreensis]|uniref:Uncharacterized protein n=1 Tax=Pseudosulfitobacter koreensis TaxID=2968472 RepID=A0ABT1Z3E4_9RHOB|nr:hypothetical protein [Pseudosulfitobacter koreense]MCR8827623.1 hypothetical protein [Pseudosulfitobacter koreense]
MRPTKSYRLTVPDQFANIAWISSLDLWITAHGILSNSGLRDHFGRFAVKEAMKIATKCDHLRFDHRDQNRIIVDGLERKGLNLAAHPFRMNCFLSTMWRFADQDILSTFTVYGDSYMFYGWLENLGSAASARDGQPYAPPNNIFADSVHLDH